MEQLRRKADGLRIYVPMPTQQEFHASNAKEKLIRGSNRSGKTTCAAVEVARAVTGNDPRYPKENGIAYIVGKDSREVAHVMYKLMFRAGAFKMIRDENSDWRSYNPTNLADLLRKKEAKPAPPLIPPRYIKSISWEKKSENVPRLIKLHNGWELHFFSSNAKPPHGTQIDLAWFDEEIIDGDWYPEVSARLVDRDGKFLWSATPQAGTAQLYELHVRAEDQERLPKEERSIEEFVALLHDNQHLLKQQKDDFESKLSPDEINVRIYGEFAVHGMRVFPEFSQKTHECPYFEIPLDWTCYAAIDPGRQICGVLFGAVAPPGGDDDGKLYIYDELYIAQCSAEIFGQQMRKKCLRQIEAFVIDHQMSRMTETGSGRTIEDQYSDALRKYNVRCRRTAFEFTWGTADPLGGIEAVRDYMRIGDNGPRLRILADRCPNFKNELKRYRYETDKDGRVTDKPRDRGPVHLCACIRYMIQDEPVWVAAKKQKPKPGAVWLKAKELMKKGDGRTINLGPGQPFTGVDRKKAKYVEW